jgi:hypothetical protein
MLIPERLWHQKIADTRKVLAPEMLRHQKVLAPEMLRHQKVLTLEMLWRQKSADTRKVLASEKHWLQKLKTAMEITLEGIINVWPLCYPTARML